MQKTIEFVVHCYAEERPVFASLLTAQLSSLLLWPPKTCAVVVNVIGCESDTLTRATVRYMAKNAPLSSGVVIRWRGMSKAEMFRRGHARNIYFKSTFADFIWATDCDYLFGEGCLDALAAMQFGCVGYPREYQIHKSHAAGDAEISRIIPGDIFEPDLSLYVKEEPRHAIGGLQIAPREFAWKGYLDGTKWAQPDPAATRFSYAEDRRYRSETIKIDLPGVYRFRHSITDYESAERRLAATADKD